MMKDLYQTLLPYKNTGTIVLYSNGMTHPVQARDSLYRSGYTNAYILTDGLNGFIERCLTPVSLRDEILPEETADRIRSWRTFFLGSATRQEEYSAADKPQADSFLVAAEWLERQLDRAETKVLDLRPQPEYSTGHIRNSLALNVENLRMNLQGLGSMLQPGDMLASEVGTTQVRIHGTIFF